MRSSTTARKLFWNRRFGAPGARDWYLFSLELKTMLNAGLPMIQALTLLQEISQRERVKRTAGFLARKLAEGAPLSAAVLDEKAELPPLVSALLVLGHKSGNLSGILNLIVRHYQWQIEMRSMALRVVWYPMFQVIAGVLIMIGRDTIIASVKHTDATQALGDASWHYALPVVYGIVGAVALGRLLKMKAVKPALDTVILTAPVVGRLIHKYSVGVFLEVFASMMEAGAPLMQSFQLSVRATPNTAIASRIAEWEYFIRDGETMYDTFRHTDVFTKEALAMVAAGEVSARAPALMKRLAAYYEDEIRSVTTGLIKIILPLTVPLVAIGYFVTPLALAPLAFALVLLIVVF